MDLVIQYAGEGFVDVGEPGEGVELVRVYWPWEKGMGGEARPARGLTVFVDGAGSEETKWNHLARIDPLWDMIKRSRFVCFADDDVYRVGGTWREAFDLLWGTGATVGQCALTRDSFYSHPVTLVDPESDYRRTNFVEMMAPILASRYAMHWREAFRDAGPVAWGVEALWSGGGCAILDRTPMRHTRPVRALEHAVRFGRDPYQDRADYMRRWRLAIPDRFETVSRHRVER